MSVSLCVYLSVCLSCPCSNNWKPWSRYFILVCNYIFRISGSNLCVKVIGWRSRSQQQQGLYEHTFVVCLWLKGNLVSSDVIVHHMDFYNQYYWHYIWMWCMCCAFSASPWEKPTSHTSSGDACIHQVVRRVNHRQAVEEHYLTTLTTLAVSRRRVLRVLWRLSHFTMVTFIADVKKAHFSLVHSPIWRLRVPTGKILIALLYTSARSWNS